jgi:hypothetical protein
MLDIKARLQAIRGLDLSKPAKGKLNLKNLTQGGYLDIKGETYQVVSVSRYLDVKWDNFKKRKDDYWVTELQLVHLVSGSHTFIEWEFDDELEISETLNEVKLRDIKFSGKPLTRGTLEAIAEEEEGTVSCDGKDYHYVEDDTWAALYYRLADSDGMPVRLYEFSADDDECLTVEAWHVEEDKPSREAFVSQGVKPQSVVVLQQGN